MVPNHPVMQEAPEPHPPTTPSGATALAPTYAPAAASAAAIRHQPKSGTVSKQLLMPGAGAETLDVLIDRIGVRVSYEPKASIFQENDPAENVFKVVNGLVCTFKILADGRRPIGSFYLSNDFFGFGLADQYTLSAQAVTNAKVLVIRKSVLWAEATRDAAIGRQLLLVTTRELAHLRRRELLLLKNAQERVGEFILEMEKRTKVGNSIQLPMTRQDIADYLGLTIETVSRILTSLAICAAIEKPALRQIVLRSHSVLRTAIEDQGKGALSNPHSMSNTQQKRSNRSQLLRARRRVMPKTTVRTTVGRTMDRAATT